MDIHQALLDEHSKEQMQKIARFIGTDKVRLGNLMKLVLANEPKISARASWAVIHTTLKNPSVLNPWIKKMIAMLSTTSDSSVKRNLLRMLDEMKIPHNLQGEMLAIGYELLVSVKEPVAVKVFAMTVLCNLAIEHPDLKPELRLVVNGLLENDPQPSILSR
jgi:hypothetical protein